MRYHPIDQYWLRVYRATRSRATIADKSTAQHEASNELDKTHVIHARPRGLRLYRPPLLASLAAPESNDRHRGASCAHERYLIQFLLENIGSILVQRQALGIIIICRD